MTFEASLRKIESQKVALDLADQTIAAQKELVASLEKRDEYRNREIEALRSALTAEKEATQLERKRAEDALRRIEELDKQLAKAKSRAKRNFFIGAAVAYVLMLL